MSCMRSSTVAGRGGRSDWPVPRRSNWINPANDPSRRKIRASVGSSQNSSMWETPPQTRIRSTVLRRTLDRRCAGRRLSRRSAPRGRGPPGHPSGCCAAREGAAVSVRKVGRSERTGPPAWTVGRLRRCRHRASGATRVVQVVVAVVVGVAAVVVVAAPVTAVAPAVPTAAPARRRARHRGRCGPGQPRRSAPSRYPRSLPSRHRRRSGRRTSRRRQPPEQSEPCASEPQPFRGSAGTLCPRHRKQSARSAPAAVTEPTPPLSAS